MTREELILQIKHKASFLCIGLDTDLQKIPKHLLEFEDPVFEFNKRIIEATLPFTVAYKPNLAFYESMGLKGLMSLKKTMELIPNSVFTIADAKRGDIGNTAAMYADAFLGGENSDFNFDSITVAPYMGEDSIKPFLHNKKKWAIILGLTSNPGSGDFQQLQMVNHQKLFEVVLSKSASWGTPNDMMFVIGATRGEDIGVCRKILPDHFFLVPGVGAQGGSLTDVCSFGFNPDVGVLVNSSRGIIYASQGLDFAEAARSAAQKLQMEMKQQLAKVGLLNE